MFDIEDRMARATAENDVDAQQQLIQRIDEAYTYSSILVKAMTIEREYRTAHEDK